MALSCSQAARLLECVPAYVAQLCHAKKLPSHKVKGEWVIQNDDLVQYLLMKAHSVKAVAKHHKVHPETVRRWLREGKVIGIKEGHWLVENPIVKPSGAHKKPRKRSGTSEIHLP